MRSLDALLEPAMALHGVVGSNQYVFDLDNAAGAQLDILGEYVGVNRVLSFSVPDEEQEQRTIIRKSVSSSDTRHGATIPPLYSLYYLYVGNIGDRQKIGDVLAITSTDNIISRSDTIYELEGMISWEEEVDGRTIIYDESFSNQIFNFPRFVDGEIVFEAGRTYYFEYGTSVQNNQTIEGYWLLDYNPEDVALPTNTRLMNDDEYRMMIKLRIARNQWDGTNESAEEIYRTILGDSINLRQKDNQDCSIDIRVDGTTTQRLTRILEETDNLLVPAGVLKNVIESDENTGVELWLGAKAVGLEIYEEAAMIGE